MDESADLARIVLDSFVQCVERERVQVDPPFRENGAVEFLSSRLRAPFDVVLVAGERRN